MGRRRTFVVIGAVAAVAAVVRRLRRGHSGRNVPGGLLVSDAAFYDSLAQRLFGSFYMGVAADVAAVAPEGARVLEVGCGPGHLSIRLARQHDLDVTGVDLDPAMIERARAHADPRGDSGHRRPTFLVGDVASLAFPDRSFDLVVSTLSMHHWDDPRAGLAEIGRVLRPGGQALVWDLRPGLVPFHAHALDPFQHTEGSPLRVANVTPWRWPWRLSLTQRIELTSDSVSV